MLNLLKSEMDDNRNSKDYGLQVAAHAHGDDGMQTSYKKGKLLSTCTEMSDATMDLMIKYNAYYIPTLSA
jgi:imidazolonepropionase-like amidohydrolase